MSDVHALGLSVRVFTVIYFLFVMVLCVLALTSTIYVIYLERLADDSAPMPAWVRLFTRNSVRPIADKFHDTFVQYVMA